METNDLDGTDNGHAPQRTRGGVQVTNARPSVNGWWITAVFPCAGAFVVLLPHIAQNESYHAFADQRKIWAIPNFWNVVSNLPFAIVGVWGLCRLCGTTARVLFTGLFLTSVGSAYYHLAPNDTRLIWDRLPMTLVFMSFLAAIIAEGRSPRWEALTLTLLVFLGVASILENQGEFAPISLGAVRPGNDAAAGPLGHKWEALAMESSGAVCGGENCGALRLIDILGSALERAHLEASSWSCRRILHSPMVL
jgi:hypothetical protein